MKKLMMMALLMVISVTAKALSYEPYLPCPASLQIWSRTYII